MKYFILIVNNPKFLFLSYAISILIATFLFSFIENLKLLDSFYWAFITSLTIGYGDISPNTPLGKLLTIIFAHFWIFLVIPSVISHVLAILIKNRNEFTYEEQEEIKKLLMQALNERVKNYKNPNNEDEEEEKVEDSDKVCPECVSAEYFEIFIKNFNLMILIDISYL